jgi:hypothetical protein
MQIPFTIADTLSETVLMKIELSLLGITLAVLILFEELIETETDPILSEFSDTETKQPF